MTLPAAAAALLAQLLAEYRPARLLTLGPATVPLLERHTALVPDGHRQHLTDPEALPTLGRFDLAVAAGVLDALEARAGGQLLARLRDLHTARFAVVVAGDDDAPRWPSNALFALGLTRLAAGPGWRLFGYDLADYKLTPDWLNARDWANPEMWDKAWW